MGVIILGLLYSACGDYGITNGMPRTIFFFKKADYLSVLYASKKALNDNGYIVNTERLTYHELEGQKDDYKISISLDIGQGGMIGFEKGVNVFIAEYMMTENTKNQQHMVNVDERAYAIKRAIEKNLENE